MAVVDGASKTMLAHLNRVGASLVIRRPIHPRTLRLALLHELYRGPERRKRKRTHIGHPIRVGAGLFKQRATLLELSDTGARVELPKEPKVGMKLNLLLGKELTLGKPLKLTAKVVRGIRAPGENGMPELVDQIQEDAFLDPVAAVLDAAERRHLDPVARLLPDVHGAHVQPLDIGLGARQRVGADTRRQTKGGRVGNLHHLRVVIRHADDGHHQEDFAHHGHDHHEGESHAHGMVSLEGASLVPS